ncbi:hypothetical protein CROQUDRAFT_85923 [Cronartium quercuum f. sp. fusiforme G11]|uniref:Uncharacterized protein n=1 Tax=Cronartium quercuum f. sp. fusiforme G11 TaxID=708437 RepID=A0A9P6NRS4_9BASI|nr:hypothetical protein CROQUDRAFT_85923 [Cronartium quercuum f. sp. fusiforme G11]
MYLLDPVKFSKPADTNPAKDEDLMHTEISLCCDKDNFGLIAHLPTDGDIGAHLDRSLPLDWTLVAALLEHCDSVPLKPVICILQAKWQKHSAKPKADNSALSGGFDHCGCLGHLICDYKTLKRDLADYEKMKADKKSG